MHEKPIVITPEKARQATSNRMNYRVLVASLILAAVVLGTMYALFVAQSG